MDKNILWDKKINFEELKDILKKENHPRFVEHAALVLARTNKFNEVFDELLDKFIFCKHWEKIKSEMQKDSRNENRIILWSEIFRVVRQKIGDLHISTDEELRRIGSIIKSERGKKGITQLELAKIVGITQQTISFIENGKSNFSFETMLKIIRVLNLDFNIQPNNLNVTSSSGISESRMYYNE